MPRKKISIKRHLVNTLVGKKLTHTHTPIQFGHDVYNSKLPIFRVIKFNVCSCRYRFRKYIDTSVKTSNFFPILLVSRLEYSVWVRVDPNSHFAMQIKIKKE